MPPKKKVAFIPRFSGKITKPKAKIKRVKARKKGRVAQGVSRMVTEGMASAIKNGKVRKSKSKK